MFQEKLAEVIELRPGRFVFCRNWVLGNDVDNNSDTTSKTTKRQQHINLICIHGTAASHEQYLPMLRALSNILFNADSDSDPMMTINCWMYDAIGCNQSPKLPNASAYTDAEQVQDLHALIQQQVIVQPGNHPTYFVGHSYGPTWIFKYLQTHPPKTTSLNVTGLMLVTTGLGSNTINNNNKKDLVKGGPPLFRLPLCLLNCLQPLLTKTFLKIGFAPATHASNPQMIETAKHANNANDMQTVCFYYQAHDWLQDISMFAASSSHDNDNDNDDNTTNGYPALVMHGVQDGVIPITYGQQVANQLGTTLISIDNASHMVLLEQPEEVAHHIAEFFVSTTTTTK